MRLVGDFFQLHVGDRPGAHQGHGNTSVEVNDYRLKPVAWREGRAEALPSGHIPHGEAVSALGFVFILSFDVLHDDLVGDGAGADGEVPSAPDVLAPAETVSGRNGVRYPFPISSGCGTL